jgi:HK97 family phage major capsid protein
MTEAPVDPEQVIEQLNAKLDEAAAATAALTEQIAAQPSAEDVKSIQERMETLQGEVATLKAEKEAAERELTIKRMQTQLEAQAADIKGLTEHRTDRKHTYDVAARPGVGEEPFSYKVWKAKKVQDPKAMAEMAEYRTKALAEGGSTTGGYLVPPYYLQQLVELRRATAPLRNYVTTVPGIKTNLVYVPQQLGVSTVAWVSENAAKPSTDEVLGQIAINIFTLAGIAEVSNQLLEDSAPAVDAIVRQDLGRGLGIEEDRAMLNGSGTGQPTGILNTAGVTTTATASPTGTANVQASALYTDVLAAVGRMQVNYYGNPDLIAMHPRTWSKLLAAQDTTGRFLGVGTVVGSQQFGEAGMPSPTPTNGQAMTAIFGYPVLIDANIPVNLTTGTGSNRSVIIVGAFKEAWLLERDGITMDVSSEAGTSFEQNQTWFRGEERVGFTAARLPAGFQIINDVGA